MYRARNIAAVIGIGIALAVFVATSVRALLWAPDVEVPAPAQIPSNIQDGSETPTIPVATPAWLEIPSIEVNAAVQHVGVNDRGNMMTPSNFKDVAWYKYGVTPGEAGSSVIAGHLDNGLGLDAVFADLHTLQAGDEIFVTREDGTRARFIVTGSETYPYDQVPTEQVFNPVGDARLNLITCAGKWLPSLKTYSDRLIVFAELSGM